MQGSLVAIKVSVCPSVCQRRGVTKGKNKSKKKFFTPYQRSFSVVFWEKEWLVGATPSTWNFGSTGPRWNETADFEPIFAGSASAVTPSQKSSINTNRKSTTRFLMSLRWTSYAAPKPPTQNAHFPSKIALCLKNFCYKFLCVKTLLSATVIRHSVAYLSMRKWLVGAAGDPFYWNFGSNWPRWSEIADFRSIASQP